MVAHVLWATWLALAAGVARHGYRDWDAHRLDDDYDWRVYATTAGIFAAGFAASAAIPALAT
jgi:hypothetical protein